MRKNQINKRTAGKNNPVKDQTAGSLSPPPAVSLSSIFLQFIPIFLSLSVLPPFSLYPHFLHLSSKQLHFQYSFLALLILFLSIFSPSSPIFHLPLHFMAISLILLIPLFSCPALSIAAFPLSLSPLQCRTKWRLMKGGRCVCHPDSLMLPPQPVMYWIYLKHTRESSVLILLQQRNATD